jgi:hypothetical protein
LWGRLDTADIERGARLKIPHHRSRAWYQSSNRHGFIFTVFKRAMTLPSPSSPKKTMIISLQTISHTDDDGKVREFLK